ncbi:MAG: hypothetical protein IJZ47_12850 [Oscillospiraceae bacterium]|nr:hypothetical protein [Oscillospiraceae bacterium]
MNEEINEMTEQVLPAEEDTVQQTEVFDEAAAAECEALIEALAEAKIKVALLLNGVSKEKLEEAAKIAAVFAATGLSPEDAAAKAVAEYPHLKLVSREVPRFAAQTSGSGDGFSAIRSIFAKR